MTPDRAGEERVPSKTTTTTDIRLSTLLTRADSPVQMASNHHGVFN